MQGLKDLEWFSWKLSKLAETIKVKVPSYGSLCLSCKAGKMLCGKPKCPLLLKAEMMLRSPVFKASERLEGSSPPGVFVGRLGYPKVYLGPLIPPFHGDTAILDFPEKWLGKSLEEIVSLRYSLVRGLAKVRVDMPTKGGRLLERLHEMMLSSRPVDAEAEFARKPRGSLLLSDESQPFGPSAPLRELRVSPRTADRHLEKCYCDWDLKAWDAVLSLYRLGLPLSRLQKAFSLGMFGEKRFRRFVPTRWSITAVDSMVSLNLIGEIKRFPPINEYRVYSFRHLDNLFAALFSPEAWCFEWIEAWFSGTVWNPAGEQAEFMGDYEGYKGRSTYPEVGGCYFSARLAAAEALKAERRQAGVLILREIHGGYLLPVGVWNVRESVRQMLKQPPEKHSNLKEALEGLAGKLTIPLKKWLEKSVLMKLLLYQRKLA
ncbi:MAG: Nre family DNA repair protein [Candidatus Hecatellaceae archaeon]